MRRLMESHSGAWARIVGLGGGRRGDRGFFHNNIIITVVGITGTPPCFLRTFAFLPLGCRYDMLFLAGQDGIRSRFSLTSSPNRHFQDLLFFFFASSTVSRVPFQGKFKGNYRETGLVYFIRYFTNAARSIPFSGIKCGNKGEGTTTAITDLSELHPQCRKRNDGERKKKNSRKKTAGKNAGHRRIPFNKKEKEKIFRRPGKKVER
ncbi:hypothetical protein HOY80DRAFT_980934 [Tuber brumale]|nr:hypothetical protein HOY80DRAFT_980934 [Tuber brumale]